MRTGSALLLSRLIGHSSIFWAEPLAWLGALVVLIPGYYAHFRRTCAPLLAQEKAAAEK